MSRLLTRMAPLLAMRPTAQGGEGAVAFSFSQQAGAAGAATLPTAPTSGALLIAVTGERSGAGHAGHALGDDEGGWTRLLGHDANLGDSAARQSMALWAKVATGASPALVTPGGDADYLYLAEIVADGAYAWTYEQGASANSGTGAASPLATGAAADPGVDELFVLGVGQWRTEGADRPAAIGFSGLGGGVRETPLSGAHICMAAIDFAPSAQSAGVKSTSLGWTGAGHEAVAAIAVFSNR